MELYTRVPISLPERSITYADTLFLLGSCFAENIGQKLAYFQFKNLRNPFGIIYHPKSLENLLRRVVQEDYFVAEDLFEDRGLYHCFEVHSQMSRPSVEQMLTDLNHALSTCRQGLENSQFVFISLGTAYHYWHRRNSHSVANCHKQPESHFSKRLSAPQELQKSLLGIESMLEQLNPELDVIYTVSPVRHLKDGFVGNQRSKSHLIMALHQHLESSKAHYFPAYEILMDELRDYRYFKRDLLHPNELAVDYIWERFQLSWISEAAMQTLKEVEQIRKSLNHRPFNPDSPAHQSFMERLSQRIQEVESQFPHIKLQP